MSFQIRKQIAMPARTRSANATAGTSKYPLAQLEIGDGFFVPGAKPSVSVTLSKYSKRHGIKLETRKGVDFATYDDEGNGVGEQVPGLFVKRVALEATA